MLLLWGISVLCAMIISGPVYRILGMEKGNIAEAFHVPMIQVSYTTLTEWDSMPQKLQDRISEFLSTDEMKKYFDPYFADVTKDHFELNNGIHGIITRRLSPRGSC